MAGGQERVLRGRIRSVQAIKKITRAMELIATSRIVKAQQRVHAAVPYSEKITEVVRDLAAAGAAQDSPLLGGRGEIKADVVAGKQYQVIPVGRRAEGYFRFRGYQLGERFAGFSDNPTIADA